VLADIRQRLSSFDGAPDFANNRALRRIARRYLRGYELTTADRLELEKNFRVAEHVPGVGVVYRD